MLKIAICDDNVPFTTELESLVKSTALHHHIKVDTDIFFDGKSLYHHICSGIYYDLIYLDIEMNNLNGIEVARHLRSDNLSTILIYISAYETYYKQLFEVEPFRFISKPVDVTLFEKYFLSAYQRICSHTNYFTYSFHQTYSKVPFSEIIFFESKGRCILIHTSTQTHRFLGKLDEVEMKINKYKLDFLRIHQSYLINPQYICSMTLSSVLLQNNYRLTISPKFQKTIRSQYLYLIEDL